jgi:hypothetical protein
MRLSKPTKAMVPNQAATSAQDRRLSIGLIPFFFPRTSRPLLYKLVTTPGKEKITILLLGPDSSTHQTGFIRPPDWDESATEAGR